MRSACGTISTRPGWTGPFSQRVLLALTEAGLARQRAYEIVQRHAMAAWRGEGDFGDLLGADPEVVEHLAREQLEGLFDLGHHRRHADEILKRVLDDG